MRFLFIRLLCHVDSAADVAERAVCP